MTSREARSLLDRQQILALRAKSRIFGNIDTDIRLLTLAEIVDCTMRSVYTPERIDAYFHAEDKFYELLKSKKRV